METRIKYPRTPHLAWSLGRTSDDIESCTRFEGHEIVITEKMDGENTSIYRDAVHARSLDSRHHPSRAWVKALQAEIGWQIPKGMRLCGENLYAEHSIRYDNLASYFYLFSAWEGETCLSWDDTCEYAALLGLTLPVVLYRGEWDEKRVRGLDIDTDKSEGYVVRKTQSFERCAFQDNLAKWVRPQHVQTDTHWMYAEVKPNALSAQPRTLEDIIR